MADTNAGDYNTGYCNTGNYNTGDCNTGDYNTGNRNTGYCNTGNYNTGDYNTGYYNTGNRNTGDCNTDKPTVRLFNHDSGWEFFGKYHREFRNIISKYQNLKCEWVYEKNMSDKEKVINPTYKTTGGYLKVNELTYNGKEVTKEDREFLESVPNFDAEILKECTGIVFNDKKKIIIDGKTIEISQDSYEELKRQLL
jgi:hypothetical protein